MENPAQFRVKIYTVHADTRRYTPEMITWLLSDVMRRAGLKPLQGRTGPRVHDLRHSMVVNRILEWYRTGINPRCRCTACSTSGSAAVELPVPSSTSIRSCLSPSAMSLPALCEGGHINGSNRCIRGSVCCQIVSVGHYGRLLPSCSDDDRLRLIPL